ncbi:MAG: beta-glucosidase, partial [Microcoleus sp.]
QGRISISQIKESVKRIWQAKIKVGLSIEPTATNPKFDPAQPLVVKGESSSDLGLLANPDARATAADILRDSLKFGGNLPLIAKKPSENQVLRNLIIVDDVLGCEFLGKHTPAIALPEQFGYELQLIDDRTGAIAHNASSEHFSPTLLQIFIRGNCFRGSADLTQAARDWFKTLLSTGELQAVLIYGSPYVLEQFLPHLPPSIPYVFCFGQMPAAQSLALELLFGSDKTGNS